MMPPAEHEVVHGRFEVVVPSWRDGTAELREAETGRRAVMACGGYFLEDASSFAMASWVRAAGRADLAEVLALRPTVLAWGFDEGAPTTEELHRLALTLLERCLDLAADGITTQPKLAWIVRRPDETWDVAVPAGLGNGGELHFDQRITKRRWPGPLLLAQDCVAWLDARRTAEREPVVAGASRNVWTMSECIAALASGASAPELVERASRERRSPWQRVDFELAEELGEAAVRAAPAGYGRRLQTLPLAAVLHRKACFQLAADRVRDALATLDRVIALDPHARHFTTRALALESLGRDDDARHAHEAAIAALPTLEDAHDGIRLIGEDESVHDARTCHAYGAFLARRGELAAARPWLERGVDAPALFGPDPRRALRLAALAVVVFRLGERDRACELADAALAIDPQEPSALALKARFG